ncbi:MAG: hypothetical protein J6U03_03025, partial [Muribaculaceae bacterium]|nr:hypothetical protein [Muribaculaceae bacterium]
MNILLRKILLFAFLSVTFAGFVSAQEKNDTIYNPNILYNGIPRKYEIAGIKVTGVDNYEDFIVIGYSGLNVGDRIDIPGPDITN